MKHEPAAALYDSLHAVESRYRKGPVYPIHKRLRFESTDVADIYDWIIATTGIPAKGNILDAGCGVGFGTIRLAEAGDSHVTGISVSGREIEAARTAASRLDFSDRLSFQISTYDDLPEREYNLIVAVESLKHSRDLENSLRSITGALRPGGQLVIVEDLYCGPADHRSATQVTRRWGLDRLYQEVDFLSQLDGARTQVIDLTSAVNSGTAPSRFSGNLLLGALGSIARGKMKRAVAAFIGGMHLQNLYAKRLIAYKAIVHTASGES